MRFLFRSLSGLFLAAMTVGLMAAAVLSLRSAWLDSLATDDGPRGAQERIYGVRVITVTAGTETPVLQAYGEIRSRRTLELRAPAAGTVIELAPAFEDGATVEAGQLLIRTDPADAASALELARTGVREAEAERSEATAALELARDDLAAAERQGELRRQALDRQVSLGDRGLGTASDREAAELAVSAAEQAVLSRRQAFAVAEARLNTASIGLERARLTRAEAERRLAETELRAEFAGTLSGVSVVAGGLLSKNEKLGELVDAGALEVAFRISTGQFSRLIESDGALRPLKAEVSLDTPGSDLRSAATLSRVSAAVGEGQSGRQVFAILNDPHGFRPGDFVTVRVEEPELAEVAVVPAAAVGSDGAVLALGAEDRLEAVPVEVLRRQGEEVIIRAAVLNGREIVTDRSPLLGAGIRVRPQRSAVPGAGAADG